MSKDGWININKQPVKRTDAKIMNTLYFILYTSKWHYQHFKSAHTYEYILEYKLYTQPEIHCMQR